MGWAMGSIPVPPAFQGTMMTRLMSVDYVPIAR
jgi:hypothetical protein